MGEVTRDQHRPATKHLQEWTYVNSGLERRADSETRSTVAKHTHQDNANCSARRRFPSRYKRGVHESTHFPHIQAGKGALHPNQGNTRSGPTAASAAPVLNSGWATRHQENPGKARKVIHENDERAGSEISTAFPSTEIVANS